MSMSELDVHAARAARCAHPAPTELLRASARVVCGNGNLARRRTCLQLGDGMQIWEARAPFGKASAALNLWRAVL